MRASLILIALIAARPVLSAAAPDPGASNSALEIAATDAAPPAAAWKFQLGAGYRAGGERFQEDTGELLVSLDLAWSKWQRSRRAWGLGLHAAFSDDGGPRFAPRIHWRTPLGSGRTFLQAAAGVYLVVIDKEMYGTPVSHIDLPGYLVEVELGDLPGYLVEVELGLSESFSLVASAESLPVDFYCVGYRCTEGAAPTASDNITNYWLGAKAGGKSGILISLAAAAALGLFAAAYSSGGG